MSKPLYAAERTMLCGKWAPTLICGDVTAQQEYLSVQGIAGNDLLGSMLAAVDDETNETMTNEQLVDESITFLLAGQ